LLSPQKPELTSPHTPNGHFHFQPDTPPTSHQQYIDQRSQPYSPTRAAGSAPPHMQPSSHHPGMVIRPMHHPYAHPIYHQQVRPVVDPASELLAEKRRRNAGASARFRDRRKQREREMQEKCQFLERRVQELESTDSAKRIAELEKNWRRLMKRETLQIKNYKNKRKRCLNFVLDYANVNSNFSLLLHLRESTNQKRVYLMKIQDYQDLHQPLQHVQIIIDENLPMLNHFYHKYDSFMLRHTSLF